MAHPDWLLKLLSTTFYEPCPIHKSDNSNQKQILTDTSLFCLDCAVSACAFCADHGGRHTNHRKLRVYKASHKVSVRETEVSPFMDISEIQPFRVNGYSVYFLNPRGEKNDGRIGRNRPNACAVCGWPLRSETYCSIYCKVNSCESSCSENSFGEGDTSGHGGSSTMSQRMLKQPPQGQSFRKRSRKGVPIRAPFF